MSSLVSYEIATGRGEAFRGTPSTSADCWVPSGRETQVGGHRLPGGLLYVGKNLPDLRGWGNVEPALIDPSLPLDDRHPDHAGQGMSYWPSYSEIPPAARSGYLAWLEGGRTDPGAYIGFVFLFLYGLERRALHDAEELPEAAAEIPRIADEVERLLALYGQNGSFRGYATGFLEVLRARLDTGDDERVPALTGGGRRTEPPFSLRCGIARMALNGIRLPADWALAWARSDPEIPLRTPATRCAQEFDRLFQHRYQARHGDGLKLKPCKRTIRLEYRPASASFGRSIVIPTDLPDVTALVGPRRKLTEIVSECCDDLASYSRWVGKNSGSQNQLTAAALLPEELLADFAPASFRELRERVDRSLNGQEQATLPASEVLAPWLPADGRKQNKKSAVEAARLFSHAGFGLEPDARFGGRGLSRDDCVVVFRLGEGEHDTPTPAYAAAAVLLHLATVVSAADGAIVPEEERKLRDHLAAGLHLDDAEKRRLAAHLQWLLAQPPGIAGVKKRLEHLTSTQREGVGQFLIQVAWADGRVEAEEVKSLTKIFRLLGLDPGNVHQWLHAAQAGGPAVGPVRVRAAQPSTGYAIPRREDETERAVEPIGTERSLAALDMEAIQEKLDETAAVSALLSGIFADEGQEEPVLEELSPSYETEPGISGLDAAHSALLRKLCAKSAWPREEFEELAESLGLMPSGALDVLNEAAFEACDQPLTDGDDVISIDGEVYQEVFS